MSFALLQHAAAIAGLTPYLDDPAIREIRVTSAGRCFVIHTQRGKLPMPDIDLKALDAFLAIAAHHHGGAWTEQRPRLAMGDPRLGFRIQAARAPVSPGPNMVLRKHPRTVYPLSDFEAKGILTPAQGAVIRQALETRQTCVIAGEIGSGKTSLLNAGLHHLRDSDERFLVVEDTAEIVCEAPETEYHRTVDAQDGQEPITLRDLCRDLLRNSPDRVIIGEVRGGECLDALRAMQTGHPGLMTIHAKDVEGTLLRLEQLVQEVSVDPQRVLIGEAVDVVIHMQHYGHLFRCTGILAVDGWEVATHTYRTHHLCS